MRSTVRTRGRSWRSPVPAAGLVRGGLQVRPRCSPSGCAAGPAQAFVPGR
ncbi:MAG: hypothetical protein AVDCRST_MAG87-2439 [uncultured Thermomicrobiales bacterium]|uniref:Uncharacterized protein n=1 Tax=uncultured Thermomicrobiales bacterium TaxID=1645740 RepID=A0A6J4V795_9BACT|nr:MAG: hypothetical protein AVDCRST_MAG87-2439 [uncultured Thermomicrobiales bacterium]